MKLLVVFFLLSFSIHSYADISLSELGINDTSPESSQAQLKLEKTYEKRHDMLKTHQVLGLTTWGVMTATMLTGGSAIDNNLHMYLGITTAALYFTTAYYSLAAPKPSDIKDKTRMKWHKGLAWVHFPLMIITPILGYMYKKHEEDNKKHSSLEKQHSAFAGALYGTFTISAALMVFEF